MIREAIAKHKKNQQTWKRYRFTWDRMDYIRATTEKIEFTTLTRNLCRDFELKLAASLKNSPKDFWRYCKCKLKNKTGLGDIQKEDGSLTGDDHEKAETLNEYFTRVFTREDTDTIPIMNERQESVTLRDVIITPDLVEKKLNKLNVSKSADLDGFHPRILKELSSPIKVPLHIIFNKLIMEGTLPEAWEDVHITPIHKKGLQKSPDEIIDQ